MSGSGGNFNCLQLAFALLLCQIVLAMNSFGEDFYVSESGIDESDRGSFGEPWRTIQYAVDHVPDGTDADPTIIRVQPGIYNSVKVYFRNYIHLQGTGADSTIIAGHIDLNGDGELTEADAEELQNMVVGNTAQNPRGDVNGDGDFTVHDVVMLLNLIPGTSCVSFVGGEGLEISGFTIKGGKTDKGGGIYCRATSVNISNNKIKNNSAQWGGGIYCSETILVNINKNTISDNLGYSGGGGIACFDSNLTISENTITKNSTREYEDGTTEGSGGGIYCEGSSPDIAKNEITENSAQCGGGITCCKSSPTISENKILRNSAVHNGGGIGCYENSSPNISHNDIEENVLDISQSWVLIGPCCWSSSPLPTTATGNGGGIGCWNSSPDITDNNIVGNIALSNGGGIGCNENSSPKITGNTITDNQTGSWGGGIGCRHNSSPDIIGNIIMNNIADDPEPGTTGNGGGISCWFGSSAKIINNTITHNTGGYGGGIGCYGTDSIPEIQNNTIGDNTGSVGGGICCQDGAKPTITDNTIENNSVDYWGGGILCHNSSPIINSNIIRHNSSNLQGGGIGCFDSSSPTISGNTIANNTTLDNGGGIHCRDAGTSPDIKGNIISGNSAKWAGGIGCVNNASPNINGNEISDNKAPDQTGGGVYCASGASPFILGNTITRNSARWGGGIGCPSNSASSIRVVDNIITLNSGRSYGGGIGCWSCSFTITDNTITGNTTNGRGGGIYCAASADAVITGGNITGNYSRGVGGGVAYHSISSMLGSLVQGNTCGYTPPEGWHLIQDVCNVCDLSKDFIEKDSEGINKIFVSTSNESLLEMPEPSSSDYIDQLTLNVPQTVETNSLVKWPNTKVLESHDVLPRLSSDDIKVTITAGTKTDLENRKVDVILRYEATGPFGGFDIGLRYTSAILKLDEEQINSGISNFKMVKSDPVSGNLLIDAADYPPIDGKEGSGELLSLHFEPIQADISDADLLHAVDVMDFHDFRFCDVRGDDLSTNALLVRLVCRIETEADEQIVPGDEIEVDTVLDRITDKSVQQVKLELKGDMLEGGSEVISWLGELYFIQSPGLKINVADEEAASMKDVIDPESEKDLITLEDNIEINISYVIEEAVRSESQMLSLRKENGEIWDITYPDFSKITKEPTKLVNPNEELQYYRYGDPDYSNTQALIVRKYAIKAARFRSSSRDYGILPDIPGDVVENIFRYTADLLDPDDWPCNYFRDTTILALAQTISPNGRQFIDIDVNYNDCNTDFSSTKEYWFGQPHSYVDGVQFPYYDLYDIYVPGIKRDSSFKIHLGFEFEKEVNKLGDGIISSSIKKKFREKNHKLSESAVSFANDSNTLPEHARKYLVDQSYDLIIDDPKYKTCYCIKALENQKAIAVFKHKYRRGHICIEHAYIFTSFTRTLGFYARENNIKILNGQGGQAFQEAAAQVWYDNGWHFYDPFESTTNYNYGLFEAYYAFNARKDRNWGSVAEEAGWRYYTGNSPSGFVAVAHSPVNMLFIDNYGRRIGTIGELTSNDYPAKMELEPSNRNGTINEMPGALYFPPGSVGYTNDSDPGSVINIDEEIFIPEEEAIGIDNFSLVIEGIDTGTYGIELLSVGKHSDTLSFLNGNILRGEVFGINFSYNYSVANIENYHPSIMHLPLTGPLPSGTIIIVTVRDKDDDLASIKLQYSLENMDTWNSIPMNNTGIPDEYAARIPGGVSGTIYYYISASDSKGNTITHPKYEPMANPHTLLIDPSAPPIVNLVEGWNLISLPRSPEDKSLLSVISPIADKCEGIWGYDPVAQGWLKYIPEGLQALNDLDTMDSGIGYWIYMKEAGELPIAGANPDTEILLRTGWNLVGCNFPVPQDIETAMLSIAGKYSSIWTYDSFSGKWLRYIVDGPPEHNDLRAIELCQGYWIYVTEDGVVWDMSSP